MILTQKNQLVLKQAQDFGCRHWCLFQYAPEVKTWLGCYENFSETSFENQDKYNNLTPLYAVFTQEEPPIFFIGFKAFETYAKFIKDFHTLILKEKI